MSKIALVTGASSGIGKATVLSLLKEGFKVYALSTGSTDMQDIHDEGAIILEYDLTAPDAIDCVWNDILKFSPKGIDVLVNNAGIGVFGPVENLDIEEIRKMFDINFFACVQLSQKVLPLMRKKNQGRIINVSSVVGLRRSLLYGAMYSASKFALEGFSDGLRYEVKDFGIDVIMIRPGPVSTMFADKSSNLLRKNAGKGVYRKDVLEVDEKFKDLFKRKRLVASPERVARDILHASISERPKMYYVPTFSAKVFSVLIMNLPTIVWDGFIRMVYGLPLKR